MIIKVKNKYYQAHEIDKKEMDKELKIQLKNLDEKRIISKEYIDIDTDDKKIKIQDKIDELNKL